MNESRRGFIGKAFGAVAGVGAVASLVAMKKTWDPLPSALSAGFTRVEVASMTENKLEIVKWRGKPVFVLRLPSDVKADAKRNVKIGDHLYVVMIGLCTHLGCIPAYDGGDQKFKCACHGGQFDVNGVQIFGPPPRPLDLPPFKIDGQVLVLGEEGPEYQAMTQA